MSGLGAHQFKYTGRNMLRAERSLRDGEESQLLERSNQLPGSHTWKLRHKGRRQRGDHLSPAGKQLFHSRQIIANLFGVAWAGDNAVAAEHAHFRNDARITILHTDRFHRTLANALVAVLAFAAHGVDGLELRHGSASPRAQRQEDFAQPGRIYLVQVFATHSQVGPALAFVLAETSRNVNGILHPVIQQVFFNHGEVMGVSSRKARAPQTHDNFGSVVVIRHNFAPQAEQAAKQVSQTLPH